MTVKVPGPGKLTLSGKGQEKSRRTPGRAGKIKLILEPKGGARRELRDDGKASVRSRVRYVPTGGEPRVKRKPVRLKLRPR